MFGNDFSGTKIIYTKNIKLYELIIPNKNSDNIRGGPLIFERNIFKKSKWLYRKILLAVYHEDF